MPLLLLLPLLPLLLPVPKSTSTGAAPPQRVKTRSRNANPPWAITSAPSPLPPQSKTVPPWSSGAAAAAAACSSRRCERERRLDPTSTPAAGGPCVVLLGPAAT